MSAQTVDLSSLKLEIPKAPFAAEHPAPTKPTVKKEQQFGADEFEIRRKLFFQPSSTPMRSGLPD
jgi:hypothetical protein